MLTVRIAVWIWRNPRRWHRGVAVLALAVLTTLAERVAHERPNAVHALDGAAPAGLGHRDFAESIVTTNGLGPSWQLPEARGADDLLVP